MALWLGASTALSEDLSVVSSSLIHSSQPPVTPAQGFNTLAALAGELDSVPNSRMVAHKPCNQFQI